MAGLCGIETIPQESVATVPGNVTPGLYQKLPSAEKVMESRSQAVSLGDGGMGEEGPRPLSVHLGNF